MPGLEMWLLPLGQHMPAPSVFILTVSHDRRAACGCPADEGWLAPGQRQLGQCHLSHLLQGSEWTLICSSTHAVDGD